MDVLLLGLLGSSGMLADPRSVALSEISPEFVTTEQYFVTCDGDQGALFLTSLLLATCHGRESADRSPRRAGRVRWGRRREIKSDSIRPMRRQHWMRAFFRFPW